MSRKPFSGASRKLLLVFDVGTTFSGVSYSVLDPGQVPEIRTVTRFPCQDQVGGDSKIPTILYYDKADNVACAGAEAVQEGIERTAEENNWTKAEWFKMHLRPKRHRPASGGPYIPSLPPNKTVVQVFGDFMRYLLHCTKAYIQETHANGAILWNSVSKNIDYVLTHPNGWEGPQQTLMRKAAVEAGLVPHMGEAHKRIQFVTEGEASLHFCINSGLTTEAMLSGEGVLIVDAGGGTVDISAYCGQQKKFEEIAAPQCHFQGSIFVTSRARAYLQNRLAGSRFADDLDFIVDRFDKRTKLGFRNEQDPQFIQFTSAREREASLGIRSGQMKLSGAVVAEFFKPSISCIIQAVEEQRVASTRSITTVFLVGGFAASDWLFVQLRRALEANGIKIYRPDSHVGKAVSDGGASFYLDRLVGARVSKFFYGIKIQDWLCVDIPQHRARSRLAISHPVKGTPVLENRFSIILPKSEKVLTEKEFRKSYQSLYMGQKPNTIKIDILCYRGRSSDPWWTDEEPAQYSVSGTVEANVSSIPPIQTFNARGQAIRCLFFDVILLFGLTELKAQISWTANQVEKRGPANVVHDTSGEE